MSVASIKKWSAWAALFALGAGLARWSRRVGKGAGPLTALPRTDEGTLKAGSAEKEARYVFNRDVFKAERAMI